MVVLIDASGSMTTPRNNSDAKGATRFEAAKFLSRQRIQEQADNDDTLLVAVYTFHDDVLLIRHTGSAANAFVDPTTARNNIAALTTADIGGSTPLAGSMCLAGDTVHVPLSTDAEILQVSSDGEENATPVGTTCQGDPGTCDLATLTCTPPESWQARVLVHLTGVSATIVKVDLFNSAPIDGALAAQAFSDPERILDPQARMRAFSVSASSGLTPLEEFFAVLTRATGGALNVVRDDQPLPVAGDLNNDFCTDRSDAILVARAFGPVAPPTDNGRYDLNLDRTVGFADYQIQAARITSTCGPDPYVARQPVVCKGADRVVIDGQSIENGGLTIDARGSCEITIKNSLIVSGRNAINIVGSAVITVENSIIVGQNAVISQHGAGVLSAANSVFHGKLKTEGAFQYIDRGGNVFE
jgi:hypothetical protein